LFGPGEQSGRNTFTNPTGEVILALLKELNEEGETIIMVTHNPDACKDTTRTIHVKDGSCYEN